MIHQSAIVHPNALIGQNVTIGPFSCIGAEVSLGDNVELKSHVVIEGRTTIGNNTVIYPFASIGHAPQDLKYRGEDSRVIIGHHNIIREYVTIQPGTQGGSMVTTIGDYGLFMVGVHVAHDCKIGNNVILANYVSLAGHVQVNDYVIIGGLSAVLQHVRIGQYAMIGGMSTIVKDIISFGLATNERATLKGLNLIGMKRHGFERQKVTDSIKALEELFSDQGVFVDRVNQLCQTYPDNSIVEQITTFIRHDPTRVFCQPKYLK